MMGTQSAALAAQAAAEVDGLEDDRPLGRQQRAVISTIGRFLISVGSGTCVGMGTKQQGRLVDWGLLERCEWSDQRPGQMVMSTVVSAEAIRVTGYGKTYARIVAGRPFSAVPGRPCWIPDLSRLPTHAIETLMVMLDAELRGRAR